MRACRRQRGGGEQPTPVRALPLRGVVLCGASTTSRGKRATTPAAKRPRGRVAVVGKRETNRKVAALPCAGGSPRRGQRAVTTLTSFGGTTTTRATARSPMAARTL